MIRNRKMLHRFLVVASILLMVILLVSHTYNDILITTRHGINLWHILFDGKILDFYVLNVTPSGNIYYTAEQSCAYNILVYVVFAVWNFPLYLLEVFLKIDVMNNLVCLVYSKLLVVCAMLISARTLRQIMQLLGVEDQKIALFLYLYLTSTAMISIVFVISQYDIISVVFILLGVKSFLEQRDKAFVFWFAIAICFKYFALIVFLPLLVLRYKKIIDWIKNIICVVLPVIVTVLPFSLFSRSHEGNLEKHLLQMLLDDSSFEVNMFVVVFVVLIVWCYLQDIATDIGKRGHAAVWSCFVALLSFLGLLNVHPYWSVLLMPFIVLAMVYSQKHLYLSLLLEMVAMACHVLDNMIDFNWCYFGDTMKSMAASLFFSEVPDPAGRIYFLLASLENEHYIAVLNSVFVAAMAVLAFLSYPGNKTVALVDGEQNCDDILIVRFLVTNVICLLPIAAMFI